MKRTLAVVEPLLYVLFVLACFVVLVGVAGDPQWEPDGGGSLIVILLLIALVQSLRKKLELRDAQRAFRASVELTRYGSTALTAPTTPASTAAATTTAPTAPTTTRSRR
jgi:hypothetical protein